MKLQPKGAINYTCHECKQVTGYVYCYFQQKTFCSRKCWETFRVSKEFTDRFNPESMKKAWDKLNGADVDEWSEVPTNKIP